MISKSNLLGYFGNDIRSEIDRKKNTFISGI